MPSNWYDHRAEALHGSAFNSLFEMQKIAKELEADIEVEVLSILYLRCPCDQAQDEQSEQHNCFQFSI